MNRTRKDKALKVLDFYYDKKSYKCSCKKLLPPNLWSNFELVRLKVDMSIDSYNNMLQDIKYGTDNLLRDKFQFKIMGRRSQLMEGLDLSHNYSINLNDIQLIYIESFLDRATILSKVRNNIIAQFDISVYKKFIGDKSDIREIILNKIVNE